MTLLIYKLIQDFLPVQRRQNQKGWIIFDSPCCHHRGHSKDTRGRGNLLVDTNGTIVVNCYNCGYKAIFKDKKLTSNFENYLKWIGIPAEKLQQAKLELLSQQLHGVDKAENKSLITIPTNFPEVKLPENSIEINELIDKNEQNPNFKNCLEYIVNRGRTIIENSEYYWTPLIKNNFNKRIIIPFKHRGKIVGYTGRYAGNTPKNVPKYFNSDLPDSYLFNSDAISAINRKFLIIVEGPFDAIAIDAVGALGSKLNKTQIEWINSSKKEIIVLPDRQLKNQDLIDIAIDQGWAVSFPEWDNKIKDAADATKIYGKLWTIYTAILARTQSKLEIGIKRKMFKG